MVEELGRFRRAGHSVVAEDPFWSVVRRRHPGVDIVLLPPSPPAAGADEEPESDPETVRAAAVAVLDAWQALAPLLGGSDAVDAGPPAVRWDVAPNDSRSLVLQKALRGLGEAGGTALLRDVALALGRSGWRLRSSRPDGLSLLEVTDGHTHVGARTGPGATVVTISSAGVTVPEETRTLLVAQVREAVASWQ